MPGLCKDEYKSPKITATALCGVCGDSIKNLKLDRQQKILNLTYF